MGDLALAGATSGTITLTPTAVAGSNTLTLPAATGTILTTASSGQIIPKAALPTGSVLQVVSATTTSSTSTTSASFVTTSFSVSITPTSSSSKILLMMAGGNFDNNSTSNNGILVTFYRNSTNIGSTNGIYLLRGATTRILTSGSLLAYDSPATTSSITYTLYIASEGGQTVSFNNSSDLLATLIAMEIAA